MRHIVKLLTEKGVTDLDDAVNFLIKEGYISVHHLYYQDIFDYYKITRATLPKPRYYRV
jgi:hypothetical protein